MKTPVMLRVDGTIPVADLARALATIGCMISSDANGDMRVSKRRIRKVEPKKPENK